MRAVRKINIKCNKSFLFPSVNTASGTVNKIQGFSIIRQSHNVFIRPGTQLEVPVLVIAGGRGWGKKVGHSKW